MGISCCPLTDSIAPDARVSSGPRVGMLEVPDGANTNPLRMEPGDPGEVDVFGAALTQDTRNDDGLGRDNEEANRMAGVDSSATPNALRTSARARLPHGAL